MSNHLLQPLMLDVVKVAADVGPEERPTFFVTMILVAPVGHYVDYVPAEIQTSIPGNPPRTPLPRSAPLLFVAGDLRPSGRLTPTALEHSQHLGWAETRYPYHPLHGQRFPVPKKRRIAGNETLILRGLDCGTFSVAREWTDWADPSPADSLKLPLRRLDAESLLALVTLLEQLPQQSTEKS